MLRSVAILVIFLFTFNAFAAERLVVLAPAAADIVNKLGASDIVVGKTKSVDEFPDALKVGSHIRPNLELIISLKPDLIVIPSNRFFTESMVKEAGVPVYQYNPVTLDSVIEQTRELGEMLGRKEKADELIENMQEKLSSLEPVTVRPEIIYEVMEMPYTVAGEGNIVSDMINAAGGVNMISSGKKMLRFSLEKSVELNPDIYIYQVGPMNKKPTKPSERAAFKTMKSKYIKVDERSFSRANSGSFDNAVKLNEIFRSYEPER